jgi:hypothetical protein
LNDGSVPGMSSTLIAFDQGPVGKTAANATPDRARRRAVVNATPMVRILINTPFRGLRGATWLVGPLSRAWLMPLTNL